MLPYFPPRARLTWQARSDLTVRSLPTTVGPRRPPQLISKNDRKFYRKRILSLTRDLLLFKENDDTLLPDVKNAFEIYVKICIEYFKTLDETDIIQEDYNNFNDLDINLDIPITNELEENITMNEANNLLIRSINVNPLEKFIKRTTFKKEETIIPVQKEINLDEPYLKNKGICKKKNITNK